MTQRVKHAAADCLGTAMADETWQDIVFPCRPKHGSLVQHIRPKWKVDLELAVPSAAGLDVLPALQARARTGMAVEQAPVGWRPPVW